MDLNFWTTRLFDSVFDELEVPFSVSNTEVFDTSEGLIYKFDMPGVAKEDVDITLDKNCIVISWERKKPEPAPVYTSKKYGKNFYKIPATDIDFESIKAEMKDGVLTVKTTKPNLASKKKIVKID